MFAQLRPAIISFVLFTIITGVIYPAIVTGFARICFPEKAGGSIVQLNGQAVGSQLIAQGFTSAKYFWPRPSAAAYNGTASSGSNLGPSNPALVDGIKSNIQALRAADPGNDKPIPIELVTASASGLDPDMSPAGIEYQIDRVAKARGISVDIVRTVVQHHTTPRLFSTLGEPTINVLLTNLELDSLTSTATTHPSAK